MQVARLLTDTDFDLAESLLHRIVQLAGFGKFVAQGLDSATQAGQFFAPGLAICLAKPDSLRAACK